MDAQPVPKDTLKKAHSTFDVLNFKMSPLHSWIQYVGYNRRSMCFPQKNWNLMVQ
jgi:hypothetical protein